MNYILDKFCSILFFQMSKILRVNKNITIYSLLNLVPLILLELILDGTELE